MTDLSHFVAMARLRLARILNRSGGILYSAASTLRPGAIYLLGLNPGGDPTKHAKTVGHALDRLPSKTGNAFLDERWERQRRVGEAPLQRRVQWLVHKSDLDIREVCAANLIFVRSKDGLSSGYPELADICWPVHERILEIVDPRLIIAFGNSGVSPYAYLRRRARHPPEETFPSGHGNWSCRTFRWGRRRVVGLPHLSRYDVRKHRHVVARLRAFLAA